MARSHPPSVLKSAQRALQGECQVKRGDKIMVAVSGGGDSMCLLHVLSKLQLELGFTLIAQGVDHGLRAEAKAELDAVQVFTGQLGVPFGRSTLKLAAGGNIQQRARDARYEALMAVAARQGANLIATAHHADDRAETVLLRLLRGAGPRGLAVLPARAADRIRPFIRVGRKEIMQHVARHRIPFAEDPSNQDRRFLRSQVRHDLLPVLTRMSPGIVAHLNALADALGEGSWGSEPRTAAPLKRAHLEALWAALNNGQPGPRIRVSDRLELRLERPELVRSGRNR